MKIKIEMIVDLGESMIDDKEQEELDWLFNEVIKEKYTFLHNSYMGDILGRTEKIISCKQI